MELRTITQTITDPADWDGSLFGTEMELIHLGRGEFLSTQTVTEIGEGTRLLRLTSNQPFKVRSRRLSQRFVGTLFDRSHGGHYAGASIEAGRLLIMPPNYDFDGCIKEGEFSSTTIFVPPAQLRDYFLTLVGEELVEFDSMKTHHPRSEAIQWISAWKELINPEKLNSLSPQQRQQIQGSLRDDALTLMTHALQQSALSNGFHKQEQTCDKTKRLEKARNLVRLAEDFSNRNLETHFRMVDLCRATDVSERTLQYAFKTCLGISPMNYLRRHRLHRVRQELKVANANQATVSSIACQYGFFHFGDFSQAYKAQFGESPSQTLKLIKD